MFVHFTGDGIIQKFSHNNDNINNSNNNDNNDNTNGEQLASLIFEYNQTSIFTFDCLITESCLSSSSSSSESYLGVEKIKFVMTFNNRTVQLTDDDIDSNSIDYSNNNQNNNINSNSNSNCEVIFDVTVLSPNFNKLKEVILILILILSSLL